MIPKELLRNVRRIQIRTSRLVDALFAGEYHSVFKGRGIEFHQVREYQPGDEVRTIDWNVTARAGRPFVKEFIEERELTVMLVVDTSSSGRFGSHEKFKTELAAELGALLALSAIRNNDKVGLLLFTDRVEKFIPPKKGKRHLLRVIRELLFFEPTHRGTNIEAALKFLSTVSKRRTVAFLISDFFAENYERALQIANRRHDVIALMLSDRRERALPSLGFVELEDAESGERMVIDTRPSRVRRAFEALTEKSLEKKERFLRSINVDCIKIETDASYFEPLIRFFRMRERRR